MANTYLSVPPNFNCPIILGTVKRPSEACQLKQRIDAAEEEKDHFHTQRPPIAELRQTKDQKRKGLACKQKLSKRDSLLERTLKTGIKYQKDVVKT